MNQNDMHELGEMYSDEFTFSTPRGQEQAQIQDVKAEYLEEVPAVGEKRLRLPTTLPEAGLVVQTGPRKHAKKAGGDPNLVYASGSGPHVEPDSP